MTNNAGFISAHEKEVRGKDTTKTAIVTFDNKDTVTTGINGTDEEIREYYKIGRAFNLGDGSGGDLMARVYDVEIIQGTGMGNMTKEMRE